MVRNLVLKSHIFNSSLILGTGKFGSHQEMIDSIIASGTEMVTVAMKRVESKSDGLDISRSILSTGVKILPNTSGVRDAKEAIFLAKMAREAFQTDFIKLEIHPDPRYLLPDPIETLIATEALAKLGFIVLPYVNADPVLCKRLEDVGTSAVMPLAAPIGSNQGLQTKAMLEIIISQSTVPVIIDAGIGSPSQALECMEMGADAVLINTAIATAGNPILMAEAFKLAVKAGKLAYSSGLGAKYAGMANGTSPMMSFLEQLDTN